MIGDDFSQIGRVRALGDDRACVRNMLEQRAVGEERASRHKGDPGVRAAITGEIRCRNCTAIIEHDIQHQNFRFLLAQEFDRFVLAGDDVDVIVLTFKMACPHAGQLFI